MVTGIAQGILPDTALFVHSRLAYLQAECWPLQHMPPLAAAHENCSPCGFEQPRYASLASSIAYIQVIAIQKEGTSTQHNLAFPQANKYFELARLQRNGIGGNDAGVQSQ